MSEKKKFSASVIEQTITYINKTLKVVLRVFNFIKELITGISTLIADKSSNCSYILTTDICV